MGPSRFYPYVSCVVPVPPRTARVGFDFACRCLAVEGPGGRGGAGRSWVVEAASGRLLLAGDVARAGPESYRPLRAVRGILRPKGWGSYPVAVQLELLVWSPSKSELGLIHRPRGWWPPSERHHRAYLRAAHDTLGVLRGVLQGPPPDWLSRLAWASPPSATPRQSAASSDPAAVAGG